MSRGGSKPGTRPNNGGARRGSGPNVRRLQLSAETALELKILTLHRRALTNNQALQPVDVASSLIHAAWCEYDQAIQATVNEATETGVQS